MNDTNMEEEAATPRIKNTVVASVRKWSIGNGWILTAIVSHPS